MNARTAASAASARCAHSAAIRTAPVASTRGRLRTRDGQRLVWRAAGAEDGVPVVVLHGGPGGGSQAASFRLFDLARFRVVLIDQRGSGESRPAGGTRRNRTDLLIDDIEAVRRQLGIARWGVLGGSWGAALALAYAGRHPQAVDGVVLRGLFLASEREVRALFVGSRRRAPRQWRALWRATHGPHATHDAHDQRHARDGRPARGSPRDTQTGAPTANPAPDTRGTAGLFARIAALLRPGVPEARQRALALAWRNYENAVLGSAYGPRGRHGLAGARRLAPAPLRRLVAKYRVQAHYLQHRCWLGETRLLALARRAAAADVPLAAVHGTRDPVCPPGNLRRLARAVPAARLEYVRGAGHLAGEPAMHARLRRMLAALFDAAPRPAPQQDNHEEFAA